MPLPFSLFTGKVFTGLRIHGLFVWEWEGTLWVHSTLLGAYCVLSLTRGNLLKTKYKHF